MDQSKLINYFLLIIIFILNFYSCQKLKDYLPNWDSLDKRPLPSWYDKAKIGIFIHWGVWSVPGAGFNESTFLWSYIRNNQTESNEFMKKFYSPKFEYPEFASNFKAEFYSPEKWLNIFNSSGAKYIVFVSKHYDGYCLWDTEYSFNWNSMSIGPRRDLIGELFKVVREKSDLKIGIHYSLFEFFNDLFISDRASNFTKNDYVKAKVLPQLKELVLKFKPDLVWSDSNLEAFSDYWESKEFLAWLYNESPVADNVIVNDRWGIDSLCKHGDYITCSDLNTHTLIDFHKWEKFVNLDKYSSGYRHNFKLSDVMKIEELLEEIVVTVSCGGNILINVGPTSQGTIDAIFEERFKQIGDWLKINGEAIYNTQPWFSQNDTLNKNKVWYTSRLSDLDYKTSLVELYAISLEWPHLLSSFNYLDSTVLFNTSARCDKISTVNILGYLNKKTNKPIDLDFYCLKTDIYSLVVEIKNLNPMLMLSKWAWTFKIRIVV